MRKKGREEVQEELLALAGVGRKVADCVALFSMNQCEAVPVDTHVWDIVLRDYSSYLQTKSASRKSTVKTEERSTKSLTPVIYNTVGDAFRNQFRHHAGWAHSVLFAAELPVLSSYLPDDIQQEMKQFAAEKSAEKRAMKTKKLKKKVQTEIEPSTQGVKTGIALPIPSPIPVEDETNLSQKKRVRKK